MSSQYDVLWAEIAENDLMGIVEYLSVDDLTSALKVFKKIKEKTENLCLQPNRGRLVPELQDHGILQYREVIIRPWRVIYRVTKKDVYVLAVIDSRQNVEDVLLKRFVRSVQ